MLLFVEGISQWASKYAENMRPQETLMDSKDELGSFQFDHEICPHFHEVDKAPQLLDSVTENHRE